MADFDALDPHVACHPILPANVPIDEVRYSTIVGIEVEVDGLLMPTKIPVPALLPDYFERVAVRSAQHRQALETSVAVGPVLSSSWKGQRVTTLSSPPSIKVSDLGALLSKRAVSIGKKKTLV